MKYRRMGKTGLKISEVSIGGWLTYGGTVDENRADRILSTAIDLGINFIDLADIYSRGEAERVCGKTIRNHQRSDLVVSSKLFWPMSDNVNDRGLSRKHIMESIDKTLARLGLDYIDIYFCHRFDPDTEIEEAVRAMDDVIRQGKVLYWGTSLWEPAQIEKASHLGEHYLTYRPTVEQPRYNMFDRSIEEAVMPTCERLGMGLVVWSPLAQGLLTGKYNDGVPKGSRGAESEWLKNDLTDDNLNKVRKLSELANEIGISINQLALAWILRRSEITCAITGATRPEQVESNVQAAEVKLESDILSKIDRILKSTN